ncbi:flagellar biosynthesis anti-sigma factor FlgM [Cohnella algarum]|uniref:flagellar biosynthesis anti-sigma factor FlgM n=1 Tax=Cohnella algarum TaxID=2044859 RepID=UPI001967B352|nr:flagellar biosynthesis anti-sigma factor FlgM [Cohnella algarum]MBN2980637.1 flagellar biosynthesis anti-sigma factor FlgM [Cohnella algarum]
MALFKNYNTTYETRARSATNGSRRDEVQISEEAKELLGAQRSGGDADRAKKIEALKNEVSSGTYFLEAGKIAEKMLPFFKGY